MSIWVDVWVLEDHEGLYFELFGDEVMANEYANLMNETVRKHSEPLTVRHTIVDIEG